MNLEALVIGAGLAIGLFPVYSGMGRTWALSAAVAVWAAAAGLSTVAFATLRGPGQAARTANRPVEVRAEGYVSSQACQACHPQHYASWYASYHRTMTQPATPRSVLASFDDVNLTLNGRVYNLRRRGDEFWVEMDNPDARTPWPVTAKPRIEAGGAPPIASGPVDAPHAPSDVPPARVERRVVLTTGSHHLQVYWFETGRGRKLAQLPFDFRIAERQWIPDHASFIRPPWPEHEPLPVAAPGEWDLGCIQCHATRGRPRLDTPAPAAPDTLVAEFGIACEACHGPGAEHVNANRNPQRRYRQRRSRNPDPTVVHPGHLEHDRASQVCGQCHGITTFLSHEDQLDWRETGFRYRPGDDLTETRHVVRGSDDLSSPPLQEMLRNDPTIRLEDSFWSDGMVRVSGREYNGLIESPCFQRGELSCLSCHVLHKSPSDARSLATWADDQLRPGMEGSAACLQCHTSYAVDPTQHSHHKPGSTGSGCYNCHMPYTTYGLHKAIRSHQIDSPNVAASLETGRPNACNQCHLDRTLAWAAEHLERWYGTPRPALSDDERSVAASLLWALRGDAGQRALMAWSMGWKAAQEASGTDWMGVYLGRLLADPYDAVRFIAYRSLRTLPGFESFTYDFVAPETDRLAASIEAGRLWMRSRRAAPPGDGDALLLDARGRPRIDLIQRIAQQRDDRAIILRE